MAKNQDGLNDIDKLYILSARASRGDYRAEVGLDKLFVSMLKNNKDMKKIVEYFSKNANKRYAQSQYILAICYRNGYGVEKNFTKTIKLCTLSANKNHSFAQHYLALWYSDGIYVKLNLKKAIRLYKLSAEQENAFSQNNLAFSYKHGIGVEIDVKKAIELYTLSAEQGHYVAQYNLAIFYENENNLEKAIKLYALSFCSGFEEANEGLRHFDIKCPICRQKTYIEEYSETYYSSLISPQLSSSDRFTKLEYLLEKNNNDGNDNKCIICYDRIINVKLTCQHRNVCMECFISIYVTSQTNENI